MGEYVSKYADAISRKLLNQMKNAVDVTSLQKEVKGTILRFIDY
jgi:hypothetical protein